MGVVEHKLLELADELLVAFLVFQQLLQVGLLELFVVVLLEVLPQSILHRDLI
mgnify:CR=1 FL=1